METSEIQTKDEHQEQQQHQQQQRKKKTNRRLFEQFLIRPKKFWV